MNSDLFQKNLIMLRIKHPHIAERILAAKTDSFYANVGVSKTGLPVPIHFDGTAFNSLYDPLKEAETLVNDIDTDRFVFFAGIGGAYHIRGFISKHPLSHCAIFEATIGSMRGLLELMDISDILQNPGVTLLVGLDDVATIFSKAYLPALHGDFSLVPLRSWQLRQTEITRNLHERLQDCLSLISADYSVQAHFGRLWFRNCLRNLRIALGHQGLVPHLDTTKTAIIVAAGPGLESSLRDLKKNRQSYIIFSTDTAYSTLVDSGITPDVFVSIDGQAISSRHVMTPLRPGMTVILDICGNPLIAEQAVDKGANLVFVAGGHPFARYIAEYGKLPVLDTSSGTVTVSALDSAVSLGFSDIQTIGADFSYVNGKPYARGTYLSSIFDGVSHRLNPSESAYTALMFRTPVRRLESATGISYVTDTMSRYSMAFSAFQDQRRRTVRSQWSIQTPKAPGQIAPFPTGRFIRDYQSQLSCILDSLDQSQPAFLTVVPLIAWYKKHSNGSDSVQKSIQNTIQLALDLIAGYTDIS